MFTVESETYNYCDCQYIHCCLKKLHKINQICLTLFIYGLVTVKPGSDGTKTLKTYSSACEVYTNTHY